MLRRSARHESAIPVQAAPTPTPLDFLSDVELWYRPDQKSVIFNGGDVAQVVNRGAMSGNMVAPGASNQGLWVEADPLANNRPAILLNGTSDHYTLPNLSALTAGHVFILGRKAADPASSSTKAGFATLGTWPLNDSHVPFIDGGVYADVGSTEWYPQGNPSDSLADIFLYEVETATNDYRTLLNGTQLFASIVNTVGFPSAPDFGFGAQGGERFYDGWLYEFIVCGSVQSAPEVAAYYAYVNRRFGTSI